MPFVQFRLAYGSYRHFVVWLLHACKLTLPNQKYDRRLWVERDRSPTSHAAVHAKSTVYDGYLANTGRLTCKAPPSAMADQENNTPTS